MSLSADDLLATTTTGCKQDIVLTWSGSRAKGSSRRRCLVCVKLSPIEQDKALVKNQTTSINTFSMSNSTWGLLTVKTGQDCDRMKCVFWTKNDVKWCKPGKWSSQRSRVYVDNPEAAVQRGRPVVMWGSGNRTEPWMKRTPRRKGRSWEGWLLSSPCSAAVSVRLQRSSGIIRRL